jgi:hypothetical protein
MKKAPSPHKPILIALVTLILLLLLAACGPPPTPSATDIPPPTNTPDPNNWPVFADPWGRYSVHYPSTWHTYPAGSDATGYATTITTIDLTTSGEPSREIDVTPDQFAIWFTFDTTDTGVNLISWLEGRLHPGGFVIQRTEETVAGSPAVVELLDLQNGQQAKIIHFSTSSGVLSIFAQPMGTPNAELFELLLTTVSFQ